MTQSRIIDTLLIAADARADGRQREWERILQELEDDGAWDFESWPTPPTTTLTLNGIVYAKVIETLLVAYSEQGARARLFRDVLPDESEWSRQHLGEWADPRRER